MMDVMIFPQEFQEVVRRPEGVNNIMYRRITQVPDHKPAEKNEGIISHDQFEQQEEEKRNNDTGYRWHKEPLFIFRIFMMHPVNKIVETLRPFCIVNKMEYIAMQDIFKKSPAKQSEEKYTYKNTSRSLDISVEVPHQPSAKWYVYTQNNERMSAGKRFQYLVVKQLSAAFYFNVCHIVSSESFSKIQILNQTTIT